MARDPRCSSCGAPAVTADHVLPISEGGALHDPSNGQGLCYACHAVKTLAERELRDARRRASEA